MDEYRQLIKSPTGGSGAPPHVDDVRKAMVQKIRDVVRMVQEFSNFDLREGEFLAHANTLIGILTHNHCSDLDHMDISAQMADNDCKMQIPDNVDFWELMIETADQLYSFVSSE